MVSLLGYCPRRYSFQALYLKHSHYQQTRPSGHYYGPCPVGAYCAAGTADPQLCPAGTYNPAAKSTSDAACLKCPAGRVCGGTGLSAVPTTKCSAGE